MFSMETTTEITCERCESTEVEAYGQHQLCEDCATSWYDIHTTID